LRVELGRWEKLDREDRKCLVCVTGQVEDEKHYLLECYVYEREREKLFRNIKERTSGKYDFVVMRDDPDWMMDALIGHNVGNENDRRIIRYEVGMFAMKAYNHRKCFLGADAEEDP